MAAKSRYCVAKRWFQYQLQRNECQWISGVLPELFDNRSIKSSIRRNKRLGMAQTRIERSIGREFIRLIALVENWPGPLPGWIENYRR